VTETNLTRAPNVIAEKRTIYVVDWRWSGEKFDPEIGSDECEFEHRKVYFTKWSAYYHAAWGYILNRRGFLGCKDGKCATGRTGVDSVGEWDTRCKYCRETSSRRIANRLAHWLIWRDSKRADGAK
jgi:hypothetical protein